ncbi:uncharacterized protein [Panulirus ornatus]|uniref:uncharacterized protein n=1 Tax=Panulirus ornatus TaxID=150431 RepID=UPI003A876833
MMVMVKMMMMMMMVMVMVAHALRTRDTILLLDTALPTSAISFSHPVNKTCECRTICFAMDKCHFATIEVGSGERLCHGNFDKGAYSLLQDSPGFLTFYWSAYEWEGERRYHVYLEPTKWSKASTRCYKEGGQLVVANTEQKMTELTTLLTNHGVVQAWIGLHLTNEESDAGLNPTWELRNGGRIRMKPDINRGRKCWHTDQDDGSWITSNEHFCRDLLPFVCQKDY